MWAAPIVRMFDRTTGSAPGHTLWVHPVGELSREE
ncbi:hypothetical protein Y013_25165 (plasmid) [Rhodococcus pyridinivorans SB3094]|uniref:Uncharacterized protein n=1 Tax=Rhodococcus pyridinivorans SB3094 TaxID=1435356 RepID=V9XPG5_9NOCA|nr:hypothetical protein Y013_25165 [Rhodococcus pyridinivorans SB3094]